jgi:STE24 endopeptidase
MISFNGYLIAYILIYLLTASMKMVIERINATYLARYGKEVPADFQGVIDEAKLKEIVGYTSDNIRFSLVQKSFSKSFFLFIIISGILPWLASRLTHMNFIQAGLIFFAVIGLTEVLTGLPFDYYHTFVIEERHGFNTKTVKIWILDLIKSLLVMVVLGGLLLCALLLMLKYTGKDWWIWAWLVFLCFQLLMTVLYPTVIEPIFNKFTPLEERDLKTDIEQLVKKEGFKIEGVYEMDASRRTRHTNAYFSGIGKAKRIVLFDSLVESHSREEILSILAHEIGHMKKNHIKKQLIIAGLVSLLLFYAASKLITSRVMYASFGFSHTPYYVGLFLAGILWDPVSFIISPIGMAISRKFEREADLYSIMVLKRAKPLAEALKKMAKENLSNLTPHPLYVFFNYSHPPLLERIKFIKANEIAGNRKEA